MDSSVASKGDFPFHHGRLALSFAGTLQDRGSSQTERVPDPHSLGRWLAEAGLLRTAAPASPALYRRAIDLREAIARASAAILHRGLPSAADVAIINDIARRYAPRPMLDPKTLELRRDGRDGVAASLGQIGADAIELFSNEDERLRLRSCSLDSCGALFLTPAGHRERRWCSMARCGNRAKVAAFRRRAAT